MEYCHFHIDMEEDRCWVVVELVWQNILVIKGQFSEMEWNKLHSKMK